MHQIIRQIASELRVSEQQVQATVSLLDDGATVPFVARYRKEVTGGLDDVQLRELETRLAYLRELKERRESILKSIEEQGKLTNELRQAIEAASTKQELEDLYLPYKKKRRTKAAIAREAGLEPLADLLFGNPNLDPAQAALPFLKSEKSEDGSDFTTIKAVLDGVRDILSERWAEDAILIQSLREWLWSEGLIQSRLIAEKNENDVDVSKFRDYFDYQEPIFRVPSHRALAIFRGRGLEILDVKLIQPTLEMPDSAAPNSSELSLAEGKIALHLAWNHQARAADDFLRQCVTWTWRVKLSASTERDLFSRLRDDAEKTAINVFADNLRDLLLAAPAGSRVVMGLDPGIRTGVKVAVVDTTGKLLETATVYPHEPRKDWEGSLYTLARLVEKHQVDLIAIGNGTASRETDKLASELIALFHQNAEQTTQKAPTQTARFMQKIVVSEAGASVYSASELASQEMPDVDVSLRGAASIARRLQDPLAELVKIDPKSIGVGQYQHDVNQNELARTLSTVVEDCVNAVGVDLNTASVPLLSKVSGLSQNVAKSIVRWREENGAFQNRQQLLKVAGLGNKTFEQSAGFLRIRNGNNPLDVTGVHPESYSIVETILNKTQLTISELMGHSSKIKSLKPELFVNQQFGIITVQDILNELEKPGRDPRPDFKVARFNEDVENISDLKENMILEGTISNVAQFGAFVDLGVHQDGLIHVSQLSHQFVSDAREIVKTGDIVKVKVLEVDILRKRISLSMKLDSAPSKNNQNHFDNRFESKGKNNYQSNSSNKNQNHQNQNRNQPNQSTSAMAAAFAKLKSK